MSMYVHVMLVPVYNLYTSENIIICVCVCVCVRIKPLNLYLKFINNNIFSYTPILLTFACNLYTDSQAKYFHIVLCMCIFVCIHIYLL